MLPYMLSEGALFLSIRVLSDVLCLFRKSLCMARADLWTLDPRICFWSLCVSHLSLQAARTLVRGSFRDEE